MLGSESYRLEIIVVGKDNASGPLGGFGGALSNIGQIASGILASRVFMKIAEGILSIGKNSIQATADMQAMQVGIEALMAREIAGAMTISEAMPQARVEAERLLRELRTLAIQSPFELQTINQTFKMGMAFGFTADESMAFTRGLLNVAAGTGATNDMLDRMAYNLAQVRMQGKVTAVDVRQLAMAGFDLNGALKSIAEQAGYTIEDYQDFNKLIAEGKLDWADFASSFEQYADTQFGGASERLSKTWNGLKSNFNDVFALTMPAIMGPALEAVTAFLGGLMDKFVEFSNSGKLEELGQQIGDFVTGVIDFFSGFQEVNDKIDKFFYFFTSGASLKFSLKEAFDLELPPELQSVVDTVSDFIQDVKLGFRDAKPIIDGAFANFGQFWQENGDGIREKIQGIVDVITTTQTAVFDKIGEVMGNLYREAIPFLATQFEKISTWFVNNGPLIQNFLDALKVAFQFIGDVIMTVVTIVIEIIKVAWAVIQPILSGLIDTILGIATLIMQLVTGDWSGAWATLKQIVIDNLLACWEAIKAFFNAILGYIGTILTQLGANIKAKWDEIKLNTKETWENIETSIKEIIDKIILDVVTWIQCVLDTVTEKIPAIKQIGKDFIQGLWDGLKDKYNAMMAWLHTAVDAIVDTAKDILGISSPSTVFKEIGQNLMLGLADGIGAGVNVPVNAVGDASTMLTQVAPGLLSGGSSTSTTNANRVVINVNGSGDPEAVVREIMQQLSLQGVTL